MRELTTLTNQQHAERLAGYLVTQSIPASLEEEQGKWVIWVVNDDDREAAHEILEVFRQNPEDSSYDAALVQAKKLAKQEADVQKQARRRQVDLTKRWSGHWWYAHPATTILIVISVLVAIVCTDWTELQRGQMPALCANFESPILRRLFILERARIDPSSWQFMAPFVPVLKGEFWRPVTPIFIHFGVLHILFNMLWMYQLASAVEFVKGTRHYLLLVLVLAVTSNLGECYWSLWSGRFPLFGGMSGVVFGMIGYAWMYGKTQPGEGLGLPQQTLVFAILWMFLCMGGVFGSIANAAHLVGFAVGMFLGARQMLWKSVMRRLRS
jgi:GlpG protein